MPTVAELVGAPSLFRSVRARTTGIAVLLGGVALVGAAYLLVALLGRAFESNVAEAAVLRAQIVASTLEAGTVPADLSLKEDSEVVIQILDEAGSVVFASPGFREEPAIVRPGGLSRQEAFVDEHPYVVVQQEAATTTGTYTVFVARDLQSAREGTSAAGRLLALAVPLLLLVVGVTTWAIVGRALAPVEAIRREVAEISARELHRRVPEPSGKDEIDRLARTMNDMLERLQESRERQEHLVSDASHELRNPIAAIRHHVEVAIAHPESTDVATLAGDVLQEDLRLQSLAEDLLLLARADEQTMQLQSVPVDIDAVVHEEAGRLSKTTDLQIETDIQAVRVLGDPKHLQRIVRNLADNAARHATSTVGFSVTGESDWVEIAIEDDGSGVPPGMEELVFERFRRLDGARDRGHGGAGLGLSIVTEVVSALGGSVRVEKGSSGGARFVASLPSAG